MRRAATLAVFVLSAAAAPVFAQEEITPEALAGATTFVEGVGLSDLGYMYMWCGTAFTIVAGMQSGAGDTAGAEATTKLGDVVFAKVNDELIATGLPDEDLTTLGQMFWVVVQGQNTTNGGEADYSEEDCTAAAAE